jgi:signal transduction histidine kinase
MKSIPKLIRRFVLILLLSIFLFLVLNMGFLIAYTMGHSANGSPWTAAQDAAEAMAVTEEGYTLPEEMQEELESKNIWAVYIDNTTLKALWHSDNLPDTVPLEYTASEIASLTRGYIDDCPAFTGTGEEGLMILGYPQKSFWKHMYPSWDYQMIESAPMTVLMVLGGNVLLVLLIYIGANSGLLRSVRPIVEGIRKLPEGEPVSIKEKGILSELAFHLNKTSEMLQSQKYQLRKKDAARANWIAGVSHDIRTPLSMVMGYAAQLGTSEYLREEDRKKASAIVRQSRRMKNLINDLNLASKMEYNMQPIVREEINAVALVRQIVVDFINMDVDGRYPIEWETDEELIVCRICADKELIKRAVSNLIQNSMNHNEDGCTVHVAVEEINGYCVISVEDDGTGASEEEVERLNHAPHYMVCDTNTREQRHGLGLLIVKQIAESHGGKAEIGRSGYGGFGVKLMLPLSI